MRYTIPDSGDWVTCAACETTYKSSKFVYWNQGVKLNTLFQTVSRLWPYKSTFSLLRLCDHEDQYCSTGDWSILLPI